jgi:hypothetical protein
MERMNLERAIIALDELLCLDVDGEAEYQAYFEEHDVVFHVLGYRKAHPKPRLPRLNGSYLEPDFLAERPDGLIEVFELKTPQEKLLKEKGSHASLRAKIRDYLDQAADYSEYFDDSAHRDLVRRIHSLDVQKKPGMVVVVGMDETVDKRQLHALTRRIAGAPRIETYDGLLSALQLEHARLFGRSENLSGLSWHGLIKLERIEEPRRKYIFDAGASPSENRWSIYMDEQNGLCCEIVDADGNSYTVTARPGAGGFPFGESFYLACEFGNSDRFALLQILINDQIVARLQLSYSIDISPVLGQGGATWGTDIEKQHFGKFALAACAVYLQVLNFKARSALAAHFLETALLSGQGSQ